MIVNNFWDLIPIEKDKILSISIGLSRSPEGWHDCVRYNIDNCSQYRWFKLGLTVEQNGEFWMSWWIEFTTKNPDKLEVDGIVSEIVDHRTYNDMGYGKNWERKHFTDFNEFYYYVKSKECLAPLLASTIEHYYDFHPDKFNLNFNVPINKDVKILDRK